MKGEFVVVDGVSVEIENEKNLLEIIRKAGIDIPTFCYYPELSVHGACRLCAVENERGQIIASCHTPPADKMVIKTNTPRLRRYRKMIIELLLANHCRDCTTCENSTSCKLQDIARRLGVTDVRFPNTGKSTKGDDTSSYSIVRDNGKCILCGACVRMCNEIQNVGAINFAFRGSKCVISTSFGMPINESPCVGCGQCAAVCPTGAIIVKNDLAPVWNAVENPEVKTTVQIAPAVRVAIGQELGIKNGTDVIGKIVAALHKIGFDEVYDTSLSADLTIMEESAEFLDILNKGGQLPLFTSCCPGWIQYVEKKHPEMMKYVSTCRSPMQMFASVLKEHQKDKEEKFFNIAVMPCTAKKYEAAREDFTSYGTPNVDKVITTQELIRMIKQANLDFDTLEPEKPDTPFAAYTGAGVIFGATGGVTEAVIRKVAAEKSKDAYLTIAKAGQRGMDGIKVFDLHLDEKTTLKIAVASGLANAEKLIQRVKSGEHFDFIEIMACPGGCINGGGQPVSIMEDRIERTNGLYSSDEKMALRSVEENPDLKPIYDNIIKGRNHELLHVIYKCR